MREFDLIVIGAGIAGLTAAMTAARQGVKVVVLDQMGVGGQINNAPRIENFPGFPQGISGIELGPLLHQQAEEAGAEFALDQVERIELAGDLRIVHGGEEALQAPAIIVAAGSILRGLGIPGEEKLTGRGVSHCASCDGPFFDGQGVCIVGGGDAALDEALVLADYVAKITIFVRGPKPKAGGVLLERIAANPKIEIVTDIVVEEICGEDSVSSVRLRDAKTGAARTQDVTGVFVYVGLEPNSAFLQGLMTLDSAGHIETDILMRTSLAGVFAAGDIRKNSVAQLASVAGDGATAAISAVRYLKGRTASH